MDKLRFAVLGLGDAATRLVVPGLARAEESRLAAVASRDLAKAKSWAARHGCAASDHDGLLGRDDVDAVWIAVPVSLHAHWAIKALEAGKHVYCEKPMAGSLADARRILQAARKAGRRVTEGYMYRFHRLWETAQRLVHDELGPVRSVAAQFGFAIQPGNPRLQPELDMGAFNEAAGYPVSAARGFFGAEPREVSARFVEKDGLVVAASAWLRFEAGEGFAESGYERGYRCSYTVWGARGHLVAERSFTTPASLAPEVRVSTAAGARVVKVAAEDHFAKAADAFARSVREGAGDGLLEREAWRQAQAMEAARVSASSGGRWVSVDREDY